MIMDTASNFLVLRWSKNFVWSSLLSDLLEASRKNFWLKSAQITMLEWVQGFFIGGVMSVVFEVIAALPQVLGEKFE